MIVLAPRRWLKRHVPGTGRRSFPHVNSVGLGHEAAALIIELTYSRELMVVQRHDGCKHRHACSWSPIICKTITVSLICAASGGVVVDMLFTSSRISRSQSR